MTSQEKTNDRPFLEENNPFDKLKPLIPKEELEKYKNKISPKETPIWERWEEFVDYNKRKGRSPVTVESVRNGLKVVMRKLGLFTIQQLNSETLEIKLDEHQDFTGVSDNTYNTYRKNVNTFVIWLVRKRYQKKNFILDHFEAKKIKRKEQPSYEESEVNKMILYFTREKRYSSILEKKRDILILELFLGTGARACELLKMNTDDIFFSEKEREWIIRINGMKQKGRLRYIPTSEDGPLLLAYYDYMAIRKMYNRNDTNLLISTKRNLPLSSSALNCFFKRSSVELGFRMSGHRFRRYVATKLYNEKDVSLEELAELLGHNRISTTKLYISRTGGLNRKLSEKLQSFRGKGV